MIQLITPELHAQFADELMAMHRLRYRVFKERLAWDVRIIEGTEIDRFDSLHPAYLLFRGSGCAIEGCVRLLPCTGPTMVRDVFSQLLDGHVTPVTADVWESSRFALDFANRCITRDRGLAQATCELLAGMLEFGLSRTLEQILTVTDARMERILRRAGWPLERIAAPRPFGNTHAVAGYLEISHEALNRVRAIGGLTQPVLWVPALKAA